MDLNGRTALITGAGGGIGKAIAMRLADMGVNVILFGGNNLEKLDAVANSAREKGVIVEIFPGDLTDAQFIIDGFNTVMQKFTAIDILINNAGVAYNADFDKTSVETFDKIMGVNARAPYILTQQALPILRKSDRASIINIASVVAHAGYPFQSAYAASKHALLGFTKSLAAEVYKEGIRVHAISPGGVYTDMVKISRPDLTGEGMISPEEIADIVEFLLKNRGNAVIDEILVHRLGKEPFLV
ncbi:MAG: SDR family oxidoreductase [Clostridia bacterium]|nr:SDR family oxidoreductase [Clostridia bacterium]